MTLSLQSAVVRNRKTLKPEFLKNFQINPPKQHYIKMLDFGKLQREISLL